MAEANEEANPAAGGGAGSAPAVADPLGEAFKFLHNMASGNFVVGHDEKGVFVFIEGFGYLAGFGRPRWSSKVYDSLADLSKQTKVKDILKFIRDSDIDYAFVNEADFKKEVITYETKRYGEVPVKEVMLLLKELLRETEDFEELSPSEKKHILRPGKGCVSDFLKRKAKKAEIAKESEEAHKASVEKGKQKTAATAARLAAGEL